MGHDDLVMRAAQNALVAGQLTAEEHGQLTSFLGNLTGPQRRELSKLASLVSKAKAVDWKILLDILPALLALIPGVGPFAGLIMKFIPFLISLLSEDPSPSPFPGPGPVPPDGGGVIPNPIA
jgi:hypothetical protein